MSTTREQQYWLPGFGLSRHIVLGHIQYFLGPSASARPFTYQVTHEMPAPSESCSLFNSLQGREGYLINGMPLTRVSDNHHHR